MTPQTLLLSNAAKPNWNQSNGSQRVYGSRISGNDRHKNR